MSDFNLTEKSKLNIMIESERSKIWSKLRIINNKKTWYKQYQRSKNLYEQDLLLLNTLKEKINN